MPVLTAMTLVSSKDGVSRDLNEYTSKKQWHGIYCDSAAVECV